ncbi:cupin superfamily protein [Xylaria nigripes]|nr:cupin superfamily protein [Xylaria nigripes]
MLCRSLFVACIAFATISQATKCHDEASLSPGVSHHNAQDVIDLLGLTASEEGGYFVETFRDDAVLPSSNRSVSTAIYYLLKGPNVLSAWHRLDAAEVWHWYAGASLMLQLARDDGSPIMDHHLGPELFSHQMPQVVIETGVWQRAESCGSWTLVGTTVAPAFTPEGYEQAPPGWEPRSA